jgi:hypothetical protein
MSDKKYQAEFNGREVIYAIRLMEKFTSNTRSSEG